ncbi:MAG TPA: lytic transglycosylase domain-containing protein [Methanothrix sp.]|nr:lytic transglycosylase domain-containing protein [Methanothrix sp.]HOL44407.1 lytic transglycosylase domain-containing protein [Methanothrix sp.]
MAYDIPPVLLWAIASHESGFNPYAVNRNINGSYDYGLMQINSGWYPVLGPERWSRLSDPCYNVYIGAWVLHQCIQRHGYTWKAVGCYNSSNPKLSAGYIRKIYGQLLKAETYHRTSSPGTQQYSSYTP